MDHAAARKYAVQGFEAKLGRTPTLSEVQILQAIGALETSYGFGWKSSGVGSFNMGAITAGSSWRGKTFAHRDSYPDKHGKNIWYTIDFRSYPDAASGWKDLAKIMYEDRPSVLEAATAEDTYEVSVAMYETVYYKGFGKTAKERIGNHHKAIMRNLEKQCRSMGELLPGGVSVPPRTIKRGSQGDDVKELQRLLGLVADGMFGPNVEAAVKSFQTEKGLKSDGIVGPASWAMLTVMIEETNEPEEITIKAIKKTMLDEVLTLRQSLDNFEHALRSS